MRGTSFGVWRLDSALTRPQPPKARQRPGDVKGVTGLLPREAQGGGPASVAPPFLA